MKVAYNCSLKMPGPIIMSQFAMTKKEVLEFVEEHLPEKIELATTIEIVNMLDIEDCDNEQRI